MDDLAHLLSELTKWRETEQAALQDVEDAEVRATLAKCEYNRVADKVQHLNRAIRKAIDEQTAPMPELFASDD